MGSLSNGADQGTVVSLGEALFGELLPLFLRSSAVYRFDGAIVNRFCMWVESESFGLMYNFEQFSLGMQADPTCVALADCLANQRGVPKEEVKSW